MFNVYTTACIYTHIFRFLLRKAEIRVVGGGGAEGKVLKATEQKWMLMCA